MSKNNYIDPTKLFSLLKKFVEGGPYTSDPSEGEIDLGGVGQFTEEGAFGAFPGQMEINNPFAQSTEQTMLGNTRDVGTTQDSRALIYDWGKNEENLDQYQNQLENKDKHSRGESKYYRENRLKDNRPKNLQNPYANVMQNNGGIDNSSAMLNSSVMQNNGGTEKTRTQRIAEAAKAKADKDKGIIYDSDQNPETKEEYIKAMGYDQMDKENRAKVQGEIDRLYPDESTSEAKQWATLMGSGLLNSPGHVSMEQGIYSGTKHLADGKIGIGAMNFGSALFKGSKAAVFALADRNVDKQTKEWYRKKQRDERNEFGSDSQWGDDNYRGGYYGKYGGTVNNGLSEFLAGGTNWTPPTEDKHRVGGPRPQTEAVANNELLNSSEKQAMADAQYRLGQTGSRNNNNNQEAAVDYANVIDNYQPEGPIIPLRQQVDELNSKYPYYNNYQEQDFIGGNNNEGWDAYTNRFEGISMKRLQDQILKADNSRGEGVGTGFIKKYGGNFSESMDNYRRLFEGGGLMGNIAPGGMPQESDTDGTENYQVGQHVEFVYGNQNVSGKIKKILNGQIFI